MRKIILASKSPRRIEILEALGVDFEVVPSQYDEIIIQKAPEELVEELAEGKAREVADRLGFASGKDGIIVAADTIVSKDGLIYGKPESLEDAYRMLRSLSGVTHSVLTGICLIDTASGRTLIGHEETRVCFKELSEEEISCYVASGETDDKAGAYAIQGLGSLFVTGINGCYFNVVGLPVYKLNSMLGEMGVNLIKKELASGKSKFIDQRDSNS